MKKKVALANSIILAMTSIMPVYAGEFSTSEKNFDESIVSQTVYDDVVTEELLDLEQRYDMTQDMPEEIWAELDDVAEISKEEVFLDDEYLQISYNIIAENPIMIRTYTTGNTEEVYSVTNYTYVVPLESNTGSTTETSKKSDVTIKNTAYYSYYNNGSVRMLKLKNGTTTVTWCGERLKKVVLNAACQGFSSGGAKQESNSKTYTSARVDTAYALSTGFQYSYATNAAKILYGSAVTYSHGNSVYTVSAQISLGN